MAGSSVPGSVAGAGSVGSICFWASWIRIRIHNYLYESGPDPDPSINKQKSEEHLDFYCFAIFSLTFHL
jgi:hypothetical protein